VHLQTFLSTPINPKFRILSCDTLVANERHVLTFLGRFQVSSLVDNNIKFDARILKIHEANAIRISLMPSIVATLSIMLVSYRPVTSYTQ